MVRLFDFQGYVDPNATNDNALTSVLAAIAANSGVPAGTVIDGSGYSSAGSAAYPFTGFFTPGNNGTAPKAYLNYLVFDRDFNMKDYGFRQVSTSARETGDLTNHTGLAYEGGSHEKLAFENTGSIKIKEAGYVYIWLSNEETTPVEVYFDDFKVTHVKSPVIQTDDYYPFGLTFNSYTRENSVPNQYQFNGKEMQDELNLGWLDYGARMYMPEIGRWGTVDPLSELSRRWSPYTYCYNNPLRFVDPDGMFGDFYNEQGEHLGSDGIDDGKVYQTTDAAYTEHVDGEAASKTGGPDFDALKADSETNFIGKTNEFGLIQLTGMGNEHIENYGSEDSYSYTDSQGNTVAAGQHGDDWVTPEVGAAFNAAVNSLASESGNENIVVKVNDASAFNPAVNLGHSTHFEGKSIDMPFLKTDGTHSNNINNLSAGDTALNGNLVGKLQGSGFSNNYSNNGTIPGTTHAAGHKDHLHVGKP